MNGDKGYVNLCLGIFSLGILSGGSYISIWQSGIAVIFLLLLSLVLLLRKSRLTWLVVLVLFFIAGNFRCSSFLQANETDISNYWGKEVVVYGNLEGDPVIREDEKGEIHLRYVIKLDKMKCNKEERRVTGKVTVFNKISALEDKKEIDEYGRSGDYVMVSGKIRQIHDYQNPGRINSVMKQRAQGINAQMMVKNKDIKIEQQEGDYLLRMAGNIRNAYRNLMEEVMPKQDAAAIFAMLFGGQYGIKADLLESFTAVGIVHMLAISGTHVTLIAGTAVFLGQAMHLPKELAAGIAMLIILLYCVLAGAVPSVVRASIMGILVLLATTMKRERDSRYILSLVGLCMLLKSPLLLYDISFQLSFGATAGLLYIAPIIREYLSKIKLKGKQLPNFLVGSMAVTISAQLSVLPFIAWYFNVISLTSLLANVIIVPIVEIIIIIGLSAGLIGSIIPFIGKVFFILASLLLGLVYEMAKIIAALPGSRCYLPTMEVKSSIAYYIVLFLCMQSKEKLLYLWDLCRKHTYKIGSAILCLMIMLSGQYLFKPAELQMHCIDVGQGLCWLGITPHGKAFMIDTGGSINKDFNVGSRVDVPYLLHYGVTELEYIFLTHAHEDHAGGVAGILQKIPVKAVMIGHEGIEEYQKTFSSSKKIRDEKIIVLQENTELEIDGVKIEILYSPTKEQVISKGNATGNEFSNLFRISHGKASFLITGDLVKEQEAIIIKKGTDVGSTVLSVGHHGSHTSSSEEFLKAVNPKWSVISCGFENSFGHPHKDILERLEKCTTSEIMRTDLQGAIVFRTDGRKMSVEKYAK